MAKANTGTTVKKVLLRIKRYWFFLILSILMAAVTVASSLYVPILIGNAIDYIIGPQNVGQLWRYFPKSESLLQLRHCPSGL